MIGPKLIIQQLDTQAILSRSGSPRGKPADASESPAGPRDSAAIPLSDQSVHLSLYSVRPRVGSRFRTFAADPSRSNHGKAYEVRRFCPSDKAAAPQQGRERPEHASFGQCSERAQRRQHTKFDVANHRTSLSNANCSQPSNDCAIEGLRIRWCLLFLRSWKPAAAGDARNRRGGFRLARCVARRRHSRYRDCGLWKERRRRGNRSAVRCR